MPCERCRKQHVDCSYLLIKHPSKADLRAEIDSLRRTIKALVQPGELEGGVARTDLNESPEIVSLSIESGLSLDEVKPENAKEHDMQLSKLAAAEATKCLEGDVAPGNSRSATASHRGATEPRSLLTDAKLDGEKKPVSVGTSKSFTLCWTAASVS